MHFVVELAYAKEPLPASIKLRLQEAYPGASDFIWETGLINSDGVNDLVVLVSVTGRVGNGSEAVAVFYGDPNGGYRLEAKSLLWSESDRISWNLSIEKGSIFLNFECGALCGYEASNGNYQFKEFNGKLALIGEHINTYINTTENDDGEGYSINYLTRQAIFWRKIGKKVKEVKTRFQGFPPISLGEFDKWGSNDPRPKGAKGYIDDKFKYRSH